MMTSQFRDLALACSFTVLAACAVTPDNPLEKPVESPMTFTAASDETVDAFRGHLFVPENRSDPNSREIRLNYVRFPATGPKPRAPIVYLSGGPGGSGIGTAKGDRFALFMAMREFGDVIAFDQRGTGAGSDLPTCESSQFDPDEIAISDAEFVRRYRLAAQECLAFWDSEGVDIHGYTTLESVADLDALRRHLGADKINLWGISYGTHLALAAVKQMDDRIDRLVLASVEGLDQTVKLPARTDAYVARLQMAIDAEPSLSGPYPDIAALMRRVHAEVDRTPILLDIPQKEGGSAPFLLQRRDLQTLSASLIADPQWALLALSLYADLDRGDVESITAIMTHFVDPGAPIRLRPMSFAMDVASGTGAERLAQVQAQARTALLADYLNFPMPQLNGLVPGLDLGDAFRDPPQSDVPTLVLSGTLDGRTYPESGREAVAGLSQATIVTVENAGHNLFMVSPEVTDVILDFMRGETDLVDRIYVDLPSQGTP